MDGPQAASLGLSLPICEIEDQAGGARHECGAALLPILAHWVPMWVPSPLCPVPQDPPDLQGLPFPLRFGTQRGTALGMENSEVLCLGPLLPCCRKGMYFGLFSSWYIVRLCHWGQIAWL